MWIGFCQEGCGEPFSSTFLVTYKLIHHKKGAFSHSEEGCVAPTLKFQWMQTHPLHPLYFWPWWTKTIILHPCAFCSATTAAVFPSGPTTWVKPQIPTRTEHQTHQSRLTAIIVCLSNFFTKVSLIKRLNIKNWRVHGTDCPKLTGAHAPMAPVLTRALCSNWDS